MVSRTIVEPGQTQIQIDLLTRGDVSTADGEYAQAKVAALAERFRGPVLFARVKLTQGANPAAHRSALAQVIVELNGRPIHAHGAADSMREAVDLLMDRLRERLTKVVELRHAWSADKPQEGHSEITDDSHRPHRVTRPAEEREVVRHKSYSVPSSTPVEAVFEMEAMDYDFHLFTDSASGQDSVVYRSESDGYRLASTDAGAGVEPGQAAVTVSLTPAPRLSLAEAKQRLDLAGQPFVFFTDRVSGRGNVLYHRYDGHYGLIAPAERS